MSSFKTDQRRVMHHGREYHFVAYEGEPANRRLGLPATAPHWFLMSAGKRWAAVPHVSGQPEAALELAFRAWLDAHVLGQVPRPASHRTA